VIEQDRVHTLLAVVYLTPLSPRQGALHFDYTQALTLAGSLALIFHDVIGRQYCRVIMHSSYGAGTLLGMICKGRI